MAPMTSALFGTKVPLSTRQRTPFASSAHARPHRAARVFALAVPAHQEHARRDVLIAAGEQRALKSSLSSGLRVSLCASSLPRINAAQHALAVLAGLSLQVHAGLLAVASALHYMHCCAAEVVRSFLVWSTPAVALAADVFRAYQRLSRPL